jgi:hypothetical protein
MPDSLPHFYGSLLKVKTVENAIGGEAMKEFVKGALLLAGVLVLVLGVRFAAFFPLHSEATAVMDPAPIAAADGSCAMTAAKMPCLQHTDTRS